MTSALARLITIGILGPTAVTIHTVTCTLSRYEGAIAMCAFLAIYGCWAWIVCDRIEIIVVGEVFDRIKNTSPASKSKTARAARSRAPHRID